MDDGVCASQWGPCKTDLMYILNSEAVIVFLIYVNSNNICYINLKFYL